MNYALSAVTMLNKLGSVQWSRFYGSDLQCDAKKPKATNEELITALNRYLQTGNCL